MARFLEAHRLFVVAGEHRYFGPVDLLRASRTVQPFHVVR